MLPAGGMAADAFAPNPPSDRVPAVPRKDKTGRSARSLLIIAAFLGFLLVPPPRTAWAAGADAGVDSPLASAPAEEPVAPDSPRAAVAQFLELCRRSKFAEASAYLDIPRADKARGPELAQRLKAVLDRHSWIELERISPRSEGDLSDKRANIDRIALIPGSSNTGEPVELERRGGGSEDGPAWIFSRGTVQRVDSWFSRLEDRWLIEHLPSPLLRHGPFEVLYWQWLALPLFGGTAWGLGWLLSRATRRLSRNVVRRASPRYGEASLFLVRGPLTLFWAVMFLHLSLPWLSLYAPAHALAGKVLHAGFVFALFWALWRTIDAAGGLAARTPWAVDHRAARMLLPLGRRLAKVIVFAAGIVALLSTLGYSVTALVTGLGIGGLALALSAQKTIENLFGAFSIALDQPFREGDFVAIEGEVLGTVEKIGLRSTRIRTLDRTLVSIPNGKLAEMRLESYSARDRMRLHCLLRLAQGTTAAQARQVLQNLEHVLRSHPKIWPDVVNVRLKTFTAEALEIEVMAWFQTPEWTEFLVIRQETLLEFLRVIEEAGVSLAFPTHTVQITNPVADPRLDKLMAPVRSVIAHTGTTERD